MNITAGRRAWRLEGLRPLRGERGQSTIEYLVVCFVLVAALIEGPSLYSRMSNTMQNKYNSYVFAVGISDPPSKAFDDSLQSSADKVEHVLDVLKKIEEEIKDPHIPDFGSIKLPDWKNIEAFGKHLREFFNR